MKYLIYFGILTASFFIGTVGFAQIVGSIRTVRVRGLGLTLYTSILWTLILGAAAALLLIFIPQYQIALYIGYGVSLLIMLFQKRIY